ncbi:hypothetical protein FGG23_gp042 [Mycobacterium phage Ibhubesi]|uniref:Uncharacterized protein n=2 Tax=Cheoctovirus TaxID=1623281 RepID=A0A346FBY1_9CAUD|nr:hypothetical protein FGG23_gp042 [Mycobacterium phage Ibhubesi]YP_009957864.1 hypothetical protein I5H45_gp043 [Mycobacterium phage Harley]AEK09138.1 hypothetical protein PBI_IBHUBESI_42 [Mycobacterium phage Ibhubesi]AXN53206.1 hypothetical protein PBI_HARLEY_43 [Mycobacterium phage Harley]
MIAVEPFTACADCPECGVVDVHWLEEPRHAPEGDTPVEIAQLMIARSYALLGFNWFDQPGSVVVRVCRNCGHRWGQT